MQTIQFIELVYIGDRPFKTDNVCGTGTTWFGYGDVQKVDRKHAPAFLKHPDVWETLEQFNEKGEVKKVSPVKGKAGSVKAVNLKTATDSNIDDGDNDEDDNLSSDTSDVGIESVKAAILSLEQGNDAHFSSTNGVPIVSAVRNAANNQLIKAADVRAAWSELNKG